MKRRRELENQVLALAAGNYDAIGKMHLRDIEEIDKLSQLNNYLWTHSGTMMQLKRRKDQLLDIRRELASFASAMSINVARCWNNYNDLENR